MSLTIAAADAAHTLFECSQCKQTIDSSADTCRFCGAPVDHEAAQQAAAVLTQVNKAISDASYMRTCALALPVFFVLRFIPFLALLGLGFTVLSFVIPVWALIWWVRYNKLDTDDQDYRSARTTVKVAGIVVALVTLFLVILPFVFVVLTAILKASHPTS